jgi:hypothetical protein
MDIFMRNKNLHLITFCRYHMKIGYEILKLNLDWRILFYCEPGSSVSIVSGYGLEDQAIEIRFPAEAKDFSSNLCVQTGSGAHPAPCKMGIGGPFPGGKVRSGHDTDNLPVSSSEVMNE